VTPEEEEHAAWTAASRARCGLPAHVEDKAALARIARILALPREATPALPDEEAADAS
jgi:hypothetical protein